MVTEQRYLVTTEFCFFFFFGVDFIFNISFRFLAKLNRKYKHLCTHPAPPVRIPTSERFLPDQVVYLLQLKKLYRLRFQKHLRVFKMPILRWFKFFKKKLINNTFQREKWWFNKLLLIWDRKNFFCFLCSSKCVWNIILKGSADFEDFTTMVNYFKNIRKQKEW